MSVAVVTHLANHRPDGAGRSKRLTMPADNPRVAVFLGVSVSGHERGLKGGFDVAARFAFAPATRRG